VFEGIEKQEGQKGKVFALLVIFAFFASFRFSQKSNRF